MGDMYTKNELAKHEVNAAWVLGINMPQLCLYPISHCLQDHRQHLSAHAQFNNTEHERIHPISYIGPRTGLKEDRAVMSRWVNSANNAARCMIRRPWAGKKTVCVHAL